MFSVAAKIERGEFKLMRLNAAIITVIVFAFLCQTVLADDASQTNQNASSDSSTAKNWEWSLSPMYLWAASIDGHMTVNGIRVDVDQSFSDTLDNLDGALMFHFEGVYRQRWGFFADLMYIRLDPDDESTPLGDISIDYEETLAELGGFYRYTHGAHTFDGLGGLRYTSMKGELGLPGPLPDVDQRKDWVDPFFGARWIWPFADKWGLRLRGDVGGFGIGSDLTWNAIGLITFKPWKHVGFGGGYRVLYQDYSTGSRNNRFSYDATMYGPILGLDISW
jgi:hypothetical protein